MAGDDRPGYRQIADDMASRIAAGEYAVGEKVPGKIPLAEQYGVATTTAERALKALAADGLVQPVRGAGSFVIATATNRPKTALERLTAAEAEIASLRTEVEDLKRRLG